MKHKTRAVPELVASSLSPWKAIILLFLLVITFLKGTMALFVWGLCAWSFVFYVIPIILNRDAFDIVQIDDEGIRNRKVSLKWHEIGNADVCTVKLYKYRFPISTNQIDILQLSVNKEPPSFCKANKSNKLCVFLAITEKNVELLSEASKGRSKALNECLTRFL